MGPVDEGVKTWRHWRAKMSRRGLHVRLAGVTVVESASFRGYILCVGTQKNVED